MVCYILYMRQIFCCNCDHPCLYPSRSIRILVVCFFCCVRFARKNQYRACLSRELLDRFKGLRPTIVGSAWGFFLQRRTAIGTARTPVLCVILRGSVASGGLQAVQSSKCWTMRRDAPCGPALLLQVLHFFSCRRVFCLWLQRKLCELEWCDDTARGKSMDATHAGVV
jgi:hypothetical protein